MARVIPTVARVLSRHASGATMSVVMSMTLSVVIVLAASAPVSAVSAVSAGAAGAAGADAALVGSIAQRLGQRHGVRADFTQTQSLAALDKPAVSHGTLVFARDLGVLWQVAAPYRTTYVFRDTQVIEIDASGRRSVRDNRMAGIRQVTQLMRTMLAGDLSGLYTQFRVTASGSAAQWRLQLQPDQPQLAQAVKNITLSGGSFLQSLHIELASGDRMQLDFTHSAALDALTPAEQAEFEGS